MFETPWTLFVQVSGSIFVAIVVMVVAVIDLGIFGHFVANRSFQKLVFGKKLR